MKPKKIIIVISNTQKALAFEWMAETINREKFLVQFILLNPALSPFESFLEKRKFPVKRFAANSRLQQLSAFCRLFFLFIKERPAIVHCHLFEASVFGLTAAWLASIKKRIYTRHHSTMQHTYHPAGVKYDKWCNARATEIIAISQNVKHTLVNLEQVPEQKISVIHHGFKLEEFQNVEKGRIDALYEKYNIPRGKYTIGAISRYLHLKGVTHIISAFRKLAEERPGQYHLVLCNASGDFAHEIKKQLRELPPNTYTEIEFENDLPALYRMFNVFVHVPIDAHSEAFGQTYVEALAAGVPSVFTLSGVAPEFITGNSNALVVDYNNSIQIYNSILKLENDPVLREKLVTNGYSSVQRFNYPLHMQQLESLYLNP